MKSLKRLKYEMPNLLPFYSEGAEAGISYAQYKVGDCYLRGRFVKKDDEMARYWLEKSAAQGLFLAHRKLAFMKKNGLGGQIDHTQAMFHLDQASRFCYESANQAVEDYLYLGKSEADKGRAVQILDRLGKGTSNFVCELRLFLKLFESIPPTSIDDRVAMYAQADFAGSAEAALALGLVFLSRNQSESNLRKAYESLTRAASRGSIEAGVLAATLKIEGRGCEADPRGGLAEITHLWRDLGSLDAAYRRACYYMGAGGYPEDFQTALIWLEAPVEAGHAAACHAKAEIILAQSPRNEETFEKVAALKMKAFEAGYGRGLAEMARSFDFLEAPFSPDNPTYYHCLELSAFNGDSSSSYKLAQYHLSKKQFTKDQVAYEQFAKDQVAHNQVSHNQVASEDRRSHDIAGRFWAAAAFDENHADAGVLLAKHLLQNMPEKIFLARGLLSCSAEAGSRRAARILGEHLYKPNSFENPLAASYFLRAAELGDLQSQEKIAMMFYYGDGIAINRSAADYWYAQVAMQKDELRIKNMRERPADGIESSPSKESQFSQNLTSKPTSKNQILPFPSGKKPSVGKKASEISPSGSSELDAEKELERRLGRSLQAMMKGDADLKTKLGGDQKTDSVENFASASKKINDDQARSGLEQGQISSLAAVTNVYSDEASGSHPTQALGEIHGIIKSETIEQKTEGLAINSSEQSTEVKESPREHNSEDNEKRSENKDAKESVDFCVLPRSS